MCVGGGGGGAEGIGGGGGGGGGGGDDHLNHTAPSLPLKLMLYKE